MEFTSGQFPTDDADAPDAFMIFREITDAYRVELALRRSKRALLLRQRCNDILRHATREEALYSEVCQAMVEVGGYLMCWVGIAEHDARKTVRPVAHAGYEDGYIATLDIVWSDTDNGRGPTGTALRTGEPVFGRVFESDPSLLPWKAAGLQRGYRSSSALPLVHQGQQLGVITMYSSSAETFDDEEAGILRQLAVELAHGVHIQRERKAHRRAETQAERLITAIEQVAEAIVITDPNGMIVYVNPSFERVTGYSRAEALGRNPRLLKSGMQDEAFYREMWRTLLSGKTWSGRLINKRKDGSLFTEEATISPVHDEAGAVGSYVAVKRDITEALALEAQFLQSQKMEGIGRLAGGIAHDFNNILSVILSFAGFALEAVPTEAPLHADLREIERAGQRAAALTRQLLAFSRKQVLSPTTLDLNSILEEMDKLLRRVLGEDVELVQVPAPDLGAVRADPGQLEQVVMNLAINARDAMPNGGKLTIETGNVEIDADGTLAQGGLRPGPYAMVAITDSGAGMDEHTLSQIFEPFFTTKGPGKGTGLGLSTVYGIVKQSHGAVTVQSKPGAGTTFKLFLPIETQLTTRATPAVTETARASGDETVLVVEDYEAVRNLARRILVGAGYKVLTANNGDEALRMCGQHTGPIHLVLTDVVMPVLGGPAFIEALDIIRPGGKVLFMSGYTDNAFVHLAEIDVELQFIAKPFTRAELLRKVRQALDRAPASPGR